MYSGTFYFSAQIKAYIFVHLKSDKLLHQARKNRLVDERLFY